MTQKVEGELRKLPLLPLKYTVFSLAFLARENEFYRSISYIFSLSVNNLFIFIYIYIARLPVWCIIFYPPFTPFLVLFFVFDRLIDINKTKISET